LTGILTPIDIVVAWVIMHIYSVLSPLFGATSGVTWVLTIALLVVAMRLIMVPLFIKQMHTQRAMTALTPRIAELRKKHKGDKETLNSETMKLYQEAGVNPLMGCLPVVLQMPIFFALFSVLRQIAEPSTPIKYHLTTQFVTNANKARIFGVSIKDTFLHATAPHIYVVVGITVLVSMVTTYLTMRQSMKRGMMPAAGSDNPMGQSQKYMMYIMPFFALTGLYWPFGLVLYWVTTNLWTLGQQFVLLRKYPVGAAAMGPDGNKPISGPSARPRPALGGAGGAAGKNGIAPGRTGGGSGRTGGSAGKTDATGGKQDGVSGRNGSASGKADAAPADEVAPASEAVGGSASGKPGSAGPAARSGGTAKSAKPQGSPADGSVNGSASGSANGAASNGHGSGSIGGRLRGFGKGRSEPEAPVPAEPETKLVRQQRQRQSRSKRSGKR
jgi:YidC/Oxa1 family membrane protein insertase